MGMRNLPVRLHLKSGGYYYVKGNVWRLISRDRDQALALYASIEWGSAPESIMDRHKAVGWAYRSAKKNAVTRDIPFLLTPDEFKLIVKRSAGSCEITRIAFDLRSHGSKRRRPFAPSLDRTDSALPYTAENCRLICVAMNMALGEWGEDVAAKIARGLIRHMDRQRLRILAPALNAALEGPS